MLKKLLLIAFKFPPYAGVGAFRWAQMCKYLALRGYEIHVVTVRWRKHGPNTLWEIVQHPHIHIHQIPSGSFHNLRVMKFNNRILNGIRNKFFLHFFDKYLCKEDEAWRWEKHLIPACQRLIQEHNIPVVVATGHPFMANYHAATLKRKTPHIKLVQDFRDLWANDLSTPHSHIIKTHKLQRECYALQEADSVVTVSKGCQKKFASTWQATPIHVIRNGFDPTLFQKKRPSKKTIGDTFVLSYVGSVSNGREECCTALFEYLTKTQLPVKFFFAGSLPTSYYKDYQSLFNNGTVVYLSTISHDKAIEMLYNSHAVLHFNARHIPEAPSTKLYEAAAAYTPIISINFGGEPEMLITQHRWGISVNPDTDDVYAKIDALLQGQVEVCFDKTEIERYSYEQIAGQYDSLLTALVDTQPCK